MSFIIIFIFYCFILLFNKIEANELYEYTKSMILKIINNTYNESNNCEKDIYSIFQEDEDAFNYLLNSSSLESNDITSYFSCSEGSKTNYYVITFKPINPTKERINATYDINYSLYGICIYNNSLNCTDEDIIKYLKIIAEKTEISENKNMKILNMNKASKIKIKKIHIFMTLVFLFITLFIFISSILPIAPQVSFRLCFLRKKNIKSKANNRVMNITVKIVDKLSLYNFCKCFSLEENTEYFICSHTANKSYGSYGITNDEGLGYIKGIFGISIIMTLFGLFYIQLLSEPYKNFDKKSFENMFYNPFKSLINLSARYGPRVLFSCSGYIFMYKFCCFLEEQLTEKIVDFSSSFSGNRTYSSHKISKSGVGDDDESGSLFNHNNELNKTKKEGSLFDNTDDGLTAINDVSDDKGSKHNAIKRKGSTITNIDKIMSSNFGQIFKPRKNSPDTISYYSIFIFYRSQLYKLILIILTMLFMKNVLFIIFEIFEIPSPSLISFRNNLIDGITYSEIFGRIFQYLNFKILVSKEETTNNIDQSKSKNMCVVFLFWPIICELFFFIFSVPIVFVLFKYKKDPLFIISILVGFLVLLKIILFLASPEKMYSTLFYYAGDYYGLFSTNPIVNYPSFLIGSVFGYFYFLTQRNQEDKDYLSTSNNVVYFLRYQNKKLYYLINVGITFIIIIFAFFEQIYFYIKHWIKSDSEKSILYDYLSSFFVNSFYLIDNELFLCLFHYLMISLFCKNEKFLIRYLSKDKWEMSVKIYLSFSLFSNFLIIFIMQKTQTKINIQLFSVLYYGILSWCVLFFISYIFSVLFEIPFKRISHQIFKIDERIVKEKKEKNK